MAERTSSAAAAAPVSYELPATDKAAAVCCSDWFGDTPTPHIASRFLVVDWRLVYFLNINAMHPMQIEGWLPLEVLLQEC